MKNARQISPFYVRLPDELKRWIADQSRKNGSSQNSEIVRCVRERYERALKAVS